MFGRSIRLFTILGFEIRVDLSWLILAALVTWSLASGLFPEFYEDLPKSAYWWMGLAGAAGLFASIVLHELSHSLVARHYGVSMKGITLFIFGGVAQMEEDPPDPKAEFRMAVVGPLSSLLISVFLFLLLRLVQSQNWPVTVSGVLAYLAWLNLVLAAFNLLPAFPLDGGRILRSVLWKWKKDLRWSTSVASRVGSALGLVLIVLGVISFFTGSFVGGLWWLMIGFFVRMAAAQAYQRVLEQSVFHDVRVEDLMVKNPVTVPRSITLDEFIHDYVYRHPYQLYPVVSFGRLDGCVTVQAAASVPRDEWDRQTVGSVVSACGEDIAVSPRDSARRALEMMSRTGNMQLLVVDDQRLVGLLSLQDMLRFMALKTELRDFEKRA
ncbi:MAG TPA: site-2 protease family protein [Smithellaceae bacterium]|nr:site-2 protease family protein [Smithellaceae bacterium]